MNFLIKLFINNKDDISSPDVRASYAAVAGGLGIFLNIVLFISKVLVGYLSNSIAIVADAFNNLSDAGSSIITIIGFRIAKREADADHPFGHGRSEYISGLIVAMIILYMGIELIKTSFGKIIHPESIIFGYPIIISLGLSIVVKFYMFCYNRDLANKLKAPAFSAVATDSISDVYTTTAVLLAAIIGQFSGLNIDGYAGVIVGALILKGGIDAFKETTGRLLGTAPDQELSKKIYAITGEYEEILGIHDLVIHDYGPDHYIISFHAEVAADGDMLLLHDMIDNLERKINKALHAQTVVHMDPVVVNDEETNSLRDYVIQTSREISEDTSIHDFRIVKGPTHTNLIFDVVIPYSSSTLPEEFCRELNKRIRKTNDCFYTAITVDRC